MWIYSNLNGSWFMSWNYYTYFYKQSKMCKDIGGKSEFLEKMLVFEKIYGFF